MFGTTAFEMSIGSRLATSDLASWTCVTAFGKVAFVLPTSVSVREFLASIYAYAASMGHGRPHTLMGVRDREFCRLQFQTRRRAQNCAQQRFLGDAYLLYFIPSETFHHSDFVGVNIIIPL